MDPFLMWNRLALENRDSSRVSDVFFSVQPLINDINLYSQLKRNLLNFVGYLNIHVRILLSWYCTEHVCELIPCLNKVVLTTIIPWPEWVCHPTRPYTTSWIPLRIWTPLCWYFCRTLNKFGWVLLALPMAGISHVEPTTIKWLNGKE